MTSTKKDAARRRKRFATLTCKPLESLDEIRTFLDNPPPWRTLCKDLIPHSKSIIRNIEHRQFCEPELESPETFCHFDPDSNEPVRYDVTVKKLPKTLVCHDMANGYHDDSKIEGTQTHDAYTFYNWAGIDIFCYFSHHFITIPPVSWTSVGHVHGVKVIGTIITEWAEGTKLWDAILSSESAYREFASAVVAIAKTMRFDGWLLNIENKISNPEKLLEFIRYLHKILHEELVDPVLIWYDSVTITGNLNWQNGLNAKNRAFFDACDGFFTNYSWSVKNVEDTAKEAGNRITDVFIGIDVWGRNFYGGGQFNTQEAVKIAHGAGCSLAIFAPAWTHEAIFEGGSNIVMPEPLNLYEQFMLRDRALWGSLWPYLNTRLPCRLPFQTSFCRGQGTKRWMYGEVLSPGPWYNLRHQQYQPNSAHGPHGYVLSSVDRLMEVSWDRKDKKGIIKYRKNLDSLRSTVTESIPRTNSSEAEKDESDSSIDDTQSLNIKESIIKFQDMPEKVPEVTQAVEVAGPVNTTAVETPNTKFLSSDSQTQPSGFKKFINRLKAIFKKNKSNSENHSNEATTSASQELTPSAPSAELKAKDKESDDFPAVTRESMIAASINLNLNTETGKTRWALAEVPMERPCLMLWLTDAFNGGSCLKVNPSDKISPEHRTIRLFHCDFKCHDTFIICIVTKTIMQYADQTLNIKLAMKNVKGDDLNVILMGKSLGMSASLTKESVGIVYSYPLNSETQTKFHEIRQYLLLNEPGFYVPLENQYGWQVRYHEVHVPESRLLEVNCRTTLPEGGILLGHFGICEKHENTDTT
ncbi:unnamed protein product [Arctia plantaginis]|uniref:Cytosolic endo-beta-N-acetylglucosaminidase TIM barrel domain-containing protein n=1 Tax=Arctia plantaginis TaxID=874455 RepID=A0A8S1B572_ARCPL|nr:unnamed protein product [Arctia plantaginis]